MAYFNDRAKSSIAVNFKLLADNFLKEGSPLQAFNCYITALKLNPDLKNELKTAFASVLCDLGKVLEHGKKFDDLFACYEIALKIFPQNELILNNLGAHLCRLQQPRAALSYFKKALELNHNYLPAYRNIQIAKSLLVERWHFRMLNDSMRNESYRRAIFKKTNGGHETVLDIGTGTGILSIYAKQGGAKKVYACDYSETMISITNEVIRINSMTDSITTINKLSNDLSIPEDIPQRLSLAVTETFDGGLLGEHILETLIHAWENLLLPEFNECGQFIERVLPKAAILYTVPVECLQIARKNYIIKSNRIERRSFQSGIDFTESNFYCESEEPYDTENLKQMSYTCLALPLRLFKVDFNNVSEMKKYYSGEISESFGVTLIKQGFLDSFAVWFDLILDDETTITSSPLLEHRCCWEQAIFPEREQWIVEEGLVISLQATCENGILSLNPQKTLCSDSIGKNLSLPQPVISFLNCESILLSYIKLIESLKDNFNEQISILDISYFPYSSVLLARHVGCEAFFSNPNSEIINATEKILDSLSINIKMTSVPWVDVVTWSEDKSRKFNIISLDILDETGQINEEMIVLLPALRSLLSPCGLLLPSKLNVWCKLVFSDQLLISSQVNESNDELKIAEFINEYKCCLKKFTISKAKIPNKESVNNVLHKLIVHGQDDHISGQSIVSHMIDINIHETKYEEMSESFLLGILNLMNVNNETLYLANEISTSKSGYINSVLYWFSYQFSDDIEHSTLSEDSHINHCAVILDSPLQVTATSKVKILLEYHSGVIRFNLSTA